MYISTHVNYYAFICIKIFRYIGIITVIDGNDDNYMKIKSLNTYVHVTCKFSKRKGPQGLLLHRFDNKMYKVFNFIHRIIGGCEMFKQ